jgi:hypothetical protein
MDLIKDFKTQLQLLENEIGLKIHQDVALEAINDLISEKIYERFYQRFRDKTVKELLQVSQTYGTVVEVPKKKTKGTIN